MPDILATAHTLVEAVFSKPHITELTKYEASGTKLHFKYDSDGYLSIHYIELREDLRNQKLFCTFEYFIEDNSHIHKVTGIRVRNIHNLKFAEALVNRGYFRANFSDSFLPTLEKEF
ncbi:hypothetical protein [Vibrio barjaei]|uniref:hypothetical protein n=1 Tax=Vibrio barjaei TaxID=1676683 RepID=UPI0022840B32|nr:hypothetical protein [Vibrio barjaei]MCY9873827.1 hypothetical protein [Vibrio barjaei]